MLEIRQRYNHRYGGKGTSRIIDMEEVEQLLSNTTLLGDGPLTPDHLT